MQSIVTFALALSWEESSAEDSVDPVATSRVSRQTVRAAPPSAAAWSSVSSVGSAASVIAAADRVEDNINTDVLDIRGLNA